MRRLRQRWRPAKKKRPNNGPQKGVLEMEYITFEWNDQKISVLFNRSILHGITNVQVYAGPAVSQLIPQVNVKNLRTTTPTFEKVKKMMNSRGKHLRKQAKYKFGEHASHRIK